MLPVDHGLADGHRGGLTIAADPGENVVVGERGCAQRNLQLDRTLRGIGPIRFRHSAADLPPTFYMKDAIPPLARIAMLTQEVGKLLPGTVVPKRGLEPRREYSHYALNVARLPIPPLRLAALSIRDLGRRWTSAELRAARQRGIGCVL
jgi:hypothetical protein